LSANSKQTTVNLSRYQQGELMSGGHFQYQQYKLIEIADQIEGLIYTNDSDEKNRWGDTIGAHYRRETIRDFEKAVELLKRAHVYVQRIDWLVSGDDSEDSFHSRLKTELDKL
jgi:hypothetical protein